jgi:hypothetical protein
MSKGTRSTNHAGNIKGRTGRFLRIVAAPVALAALGTLAAGPAGAGPGAKQVQGHMEVELSNSNTCGSPLGLCMTGTFYGALHGPLELAAVAVAPTADPNVSVINSTSVLHTKDGDIFFSNSAVWDSSPGGDGIESSIDRITGGTGKYAGASGYVQTIGTAVPGAASSAQYWGKVVLP